MAKGKRSKVKQKHKREFNARIKPAVDARVKELHERCVGVSDKMVVEEPKTVAEQPPQHPQLVDLSKAVNTLAPHKTNKAKLGGAVVGRVKKSTKTNARANAQQKAKLKLRVVSKKVVVS